MSTNLSRWAVLVVLLCAACSDGGGADIPSAPENRVVWTDVAVGTYHTCAVTELNEAWCWGSGVSGQLGHGRAGIEYAPVPVSGGLRFRSLAAGAAHTCGVTTAGTVYCWGLNNAFQLGDGTQVDRSAPVPVSGLAGIRQLALGVAGGHALAEDGRLFCWGFGCPGSPEPYTSRVPMQVTLVPPVTTIASGGTHFCGASPARGVVCWGDGLHASLGPVPAEFNPWRDHNVVLPELAFRAVAAANDHSCGLTTAGALHCWGDNSHGQLGIGVQDPPAELRVGRAPGPAVTGGRVFTEVFARGLTTCALTADGTAYCWGHNVSAQLGDGTTETRTAPTPVAGGHRFRKIAISGYVDAGRGRFLQHACGITLEGRLYCWGSGHYGAAGNRAPLTALTPVVVDDPR